MNLGLQIWYVNEKSGLKKIFIFLLLKRYHRIGSKRMRGVSQGKKVERGAKVVTDNSKF